MRCNLLLIIALFITSATAAQSVKPAQLNEDYTYNTPGEPRRLRYTPDGGGVTITDGERRFNRALYGAHTGFRMECGDRPEFGLYLPRMGGNLRFEVPYTHCTARYEAGAMTYHLDRHLLIEAQVLRQEDAALWRLTNTGGKPLEIGIAFGGVADVKFYREGDLGVDKPDCFDFKPEYCAGNVYTVDGQAVAIEYGVKSRAVLRMTLPTDQIRITAYPSLEASLTLPAGESRILAIYPSATHADMRPKALEARFVEAEAQRAALASALRITTPDPYINPIGGALALAADGLWSGQAWLHGAVGWRSPYSGWRGAYVGDALGWHDRARIHFNTYAANQMTDTPPVYAHPRQDSTLNLARAEKRWGTQMYSDGYIARRPGHKEEMSHYDMNLCYIDELLRHLDWTGDKAYAKEIFPVIERHLRWEKRNFDPDGDHLYDGYCCIWASDALYYTSGAATHSTAYNYFANRRAERIAALIGVDPAPYRTEADAILRALNATLWLPERGHWAEYKDFMGHKRLHESAALWTIYHALDSEVADPFQAYTATRYVDTSIPHIPVTGEGVGEGYATLSTSSWKPYSWSINNVAIAEVMHTALAYWQAGRAEKAFTLMKSVAMDNMYMGASPLNFGQVSYYDAARGECYRDFGDPVGVWSRALVEGLYGIRPDALEDRLMLRPGFPAAWNEASLSMRDIDYTFRREGTHDTYHIAQRFARPQAITLEVRAAGDIESVRVNGRPASWRCVEPAIEQPRLRIEAGNAPQTTVEIRWRTPGKAEATGREQVIGGTHFREMNRTGLRWWAAEELPVVKQSRPEAGFNDLRTASCEPVGMPFNASVTAIFQNRYLTPRSPYTTLQIPVQGIGEWCHPTQTASIDDSGMRAKVGADGLLHTALGIPFRTPASGDNILYTSLWDNYPDSVSVPLTGRATHAYLMLAGSTNHMQYGIENGVVRIRYTDGGEECFPLVNPTTWVPIEQDVYYDQYAFRLDEGTAPPYRIHFASGRVSRHLGDELGIEGVYGRAIDGGAGILLDIPLDPARELRSLELETRSNDVVIGLMAITLQRE